MDKAAENESSNVKRRDNKDELDIELDSPKKEMKEK